MHSVHHSVSCTLLHTTVHAKKPVPPPLAMPIVPFSAGDIVTAAMMVHLIYKALSNSMGTPYDYQCLIMELRSFKKALKMVNLAIAVAPPTGQYRSGNNNLS